MQILGIRNSTTCIRYAVVNWDGKNATLVNASDESRLNFPAATEEIADKLVWLKAELEGIFRKYPDIKHVAIKMNQFGMEKMANRHSTHMDGAVMLVSQLNDKTASTLLYANIEKGMSSKKIQTYSEDKVGRSSKYWNPQMADAIAAAWTRRDR
tara:strand:- start:1520 stop:1981 length:462 start_codon:yes stop_codon:yes gene_type:complete